SASGGCRGSLRLQRGHLRSQCLLPGRCGRSTASRCLHPWLPPISPDADPWTAAGTGPCRAAHAWKHTTREEQSPAAGVVATFWGEGATLMDWNLLPGLAFWTMLAVYLLGVVLSLLIQQARAITVAAALCVAVGGLGAIVAGI